MKHVPNYLRKLAAVKLLVGSGGVFIVEVSHDNWCDQLNRRGPCNCDPEIEIVEIQDRKPYA